MGNSYMGWRKKGKGFLSRKGAGGRREVERWPSGSLNLFLYLTPALLDLTPILSLGWLVFGLLFQAHTGRSAVW